MKNIICTLALLTAFTGFLTPSTLKSQTKAEIANVDFIIRNDTLVITYDLLKTKSSERFSISLDIRSVGGRVFLPKSLTGDIGNDIPGGKGKKILWAILTDNAIIDDEIFVEVKASPAITPSAGIPPGETNTVQQTQAPASGSGSETTRTCSKGGAIALSAIFPGIGITRQKQGGAYWLMGVATYGALIGGTILHMTANSNYDKYKESTTASDRDKYYDNAVGQARTGNILYIAAAGIWIADMIWTIATPNHRKTGGISMGARFDDSLQKPMFSLYYRF
jgi:hypothetical protein